MWFFLVVLLGILALAVWMWKRPDPVVRDQARAEQHDLWLEQVDAQLKHARYLVEVQPPQFERAYEILEDLAKQYDLSQAYMQMGLMHWHGQGREVSIEKAQAYLEKAFRLGSDEAAYHLGQLSEAQNDTEKAMYWYRHAVAKGNVEAQYRLTHFSNQDPIQTEEQRLELLKNHANTGHVASQYQLAQFYFQASSLDISLALHYLLQAAAQQHAAANQQLYDIYTQGIYVEENRERALFFLKQAIDLGEQQDIYAYYEAVLRGEIDVDQRQRVYHDLLKKGKEQKQSSAKALLGDAHFHGWYLDKNETLGYRFWLEAQAAQQPHALKQIAALHMDNHPLVDSEQREQAFVLFELAHRLAPDSDTSIGLALCYLHGIGVAQDVPQAQQLLAQAAQKYWQFNVSSEADFYYVLGRYYARVSYPNAQNKQAIAYLEKAQQQGHAHAAWQLYQLALLSDQAEIAEKKAEYLQSAADLGHVIAQRELALNYLKVKDQQDSFDQAMQYLQQAATQRDAIALMQLGYIYEQGLMIEADLSQAINYYEQAAEFNEPNALAHLARLYTKGEGLERNLATAQQLLERAAVMGHMDAKEQLENIHAYLKIQQSQL